MLFRPGTWSFFVGKIKSEIHILINLKIKLKLLNIDFTNIKVIV